MYTEADLLYLQAVGIEETIVWYWPPSSSHTPHQPGKYDEAKSLCVRSLAMYEKVYGPDHPAVATGLNNWAGVLKRQEHCVVAQSLKMNGQSLFAQASQEASHFSFPVIFRGKYKEATDLCVRSLAILEKGVGPDHSDVVVGLNNWAGLLKCQGKYELAAPLHIRSLAIREKGCGPDHPAVATGVNNRAGLLESQVSAIRFSEFSNSFVRIFLVS
ncbi:unnamed protein product [Ectocarpus sp. CCAP 1310/34]|nr:unnamed protein product [Ectocarpus sp. CCAP 1310/34]